ncbi:MAG: tryptophan--tRNA ligase [Deltaproteobacteria bacterium GWA2_57_13]|nr:MAG: tryptophan--tRNA ligase [Deltaproteobacteria bacterium GWA2_57_13]OGQ75644.1 MAG: tryptophan--tRNA ligase [Deltaproteobacteria bacterium RIFCSPLOWO2_12_FULL_57_22]
MDTIVSGARPTGRLHLGHLHGALKNWVRLQEGYRCFFFVADWHALTTDYASPQGIEQNTVEMVMDWLSVGLDPRRSVLFRQSRIKEHAELHLLLSMITPVSWLERNPTYKEQMRELEGRDLSTYGFLGYPVLQAADITMYKANKVPVGVDQAPHVELTREIVRRFNQVYRVIFPEPEVLLTETQKLPGLDGRKMSKSYNNAVFLSDTPKEIDQKLSRMMTDPARVRRQDPGEPERCPAFQLHKIYCTPEEIDFVSQGCRTAGIGCLDCKKVMIKHVIEDLSPFREKRAAYEKRPAEVGEVLAAGNRVAQQQAAETMTEVRSALGL